MIYHQSTGGPEPDVAAVFVCDICKQPIADARCGVAVFAGRGQGEHELYPVLHTHKGVCHDRAEAAFEERTGGASVPWRELRDHVLELATGTGMTAATMIAREALLTGELAAEELDELDERIAEVIALFVNRGVEPPSWLRT